MLETRGFLACRDFGAALDQGSSSRSKRVSKSKRGPKRYLSSYLSTTGWMDAHNQHLQHTRLLIKISAVTHHYFIAAWWLCRDIGYCLHCHDKGHLLMKCPQLEEMNLDGRAHLNRHLLAENTALAEHIMQRWRNGEFQQHSGLQQSAEEPKGSKRKGSRFACSASSRPFYKRVHNNEPMSSTVACIPRISFDFRVGHPCSDTWKYKC